MVLTHDGYRVKSEAAANYGLPSGSPLLAKGLAWCMCGPPLSGHSIGPRWVESGLELTSANATLPDPRRLAAPPRRPVLGPGVRRDERG